MFPQPFQNLFSTLVRRKNQIQRFLNFPRSQDQPQALQAREIAAGP
jgi:hypothetical protein